MASTLLSQGTGLPMSPDPVSCLFLLLAGGVAASIVLLLAYIITIPFHKHLHKLLGDTNHERDR